jgi:hypothetical protein
MELTLTMDEVFDRIITYLNAKQPLSVVRYGDGEAMVLKGFNDKENLHFILKKLLGYVPSVSHIMAIRHNLIQAYREADIIGIPVTNRHMSDPNSYWHKSGAILESSVGKEYLEKLEITNIDVHSHFLNQRYYDQLLNGIETLCYISCRQLDDAFKRRYNIKKVYSFIIAPEMYYTPGYDGLQHFPDQYNEIKEWVETIPVKGNLCLVGAGVVGKIYNNWFRDQGGVSMDIGSIFDSWAGKLTRGPGRGADVIDETYKL